MSKNTQFFAEIYAPYRGEGLLLDIIIPHDDDLNAYITIPGKLYSKESFLGFRRAALAVYKPISQELTDFIKMSGMQITEGIVDLVSKELDLRPRYYNDGIWRWKDGS